MYPKNDMLGKKFGRLVVVEKAGHDKWGNDLWKSECLCGKNLTTRGAHLRKGKTKSCGCLNAELSGNRARTHGMTKKSIWKIWRGMLNRCNNKNYHEYRYYGGRGITVCKRWLDFESFFKDMGDRPQGLTLERKDNNKGYYLGNCKWATRIEQNRNHSLHKNNKTGSVGTHWCKRSKRYIAQIGVAGKHIHLGSFINLKNAIVARKNGEQKYWSKEA